MRVLVTGTAGFIGCEVALRLLRAGHEVCGFDNLNPYYDVRLKHARLSRLCGFDGFTQHVAELADRAAVDRVFAQFRPQRVVHLAAQAGVRYAAENPHAYISSNVTGFLHVLEACRQQQVEHLLFASTSSVYGANPGMPFSESHPTEHPLSLYAATKKANEQMAHSYAHLFGIPCTGLRFFTVYGPWGRPDMALFKFAVAMAHDREIELYSYGRHARSFTYIDDVVTGIERLLHRVPAPQPLLETMHGSPQILDPGVSPVAPYCVLNIGHATPVPLMEYVRQLELAMGKEAKKVFLPKQPGDVPESAACSQRLFDAVGFLPETSVAQGISRFVAWFREHPQFGGQEVGGQKAGGQEAGAP